MRKLYTSLFLLLFTSFTVSAQQLVTGKASLVKIDTRVYTISKSDGISKTFDLDDENKNNIKGVLAVLFEDCGEIRDDIFATEYFYERTLIKFTNSYNSCKYGSYTPTEKELKSVNSRNSDQVRFYGGAEIGLKNISINGNEEEILNQYGATIGIMASPSFMGPLQGNLYFSLQATMSFGGDKTFQNTTLPTNFSVNTTRLMFGSEYYFNKNGKIKPFVGIGIGLTRDFYEGTVGTSPFKIDGGDPIWSPKIGLLYAINTSNDIGITFNYIPEYKNDLSFPNDDDVIIPLIVRSTYYNFALHFYF
jgi:hypothetical protein